MSELNHKRSQLSLYATVGLVAIVFHASILSISTGLSLEVIAFDAATFNLMLAFGASQLFNILRFYQPRPWLRIAYSFVMAIACVFIMRMLVKWLFKEELSYTELYNDTIPLRIVVSGMLLTIVSLFSWLDSMTRERQEQEIRKQQTEKLAREAELANLRQQLQPHFLFNSLNSISALVVTKPEQARKMIQQLSDFLRGTLKKDDSQQVTLQEEIQHLNLYLEIEKVRFGHRLQTEIDMEEGCEDAKLPPLLLQPVIENAIKFGLYDTTGPITISMRAYWDDVYLVLEIVNPFDPATATNSAGTGFGLTSVQRRLHLVFARQDLIQTEKIDHLFKTTIRIPQ